MVRRRSGVRFPSPALTEDARPNFAVLTVGCPSPCGRALRVAGDPDPAYKGPTGGGSLIGRLVKRWRGRSPLWAKAPLGLLRHPGLLASVVVGVSLLSLVAAAYPLFLSRSEGELLRAKIAEPTFLRYGAGMFYGVTSVRLNEKAPTGETLLRDRLDEEFARLAAQGPHLGPPIRYTLGPAV